ncbi:phosphoglycerate kinase [Alphaproteobacteria bacterium]|nr:phosphoglycerate kinase [Alphaproteobacteria bacterium]
MKTINNYSVNGQKVLIRVDLNVPVLDGMITEKSRIKAIKPTIEKLLKHKNKIFLISHFGRPGGKFNKKYSLKFICSALQEELEINRIHFLESFNIYDIKNKIHKMNFGEICLFENIRFCPEEERNDLNFIHEICKNFDVYVNDAFSASHRNHASIVGAPKYLPSLAGESLLEEIKNIDPFINKPIKPNVAIIGGSKISTKIDLLHNLAEFFDTIVIGGAMANTFLNAQNIDIGNSLCEKNLLNTALSIMEKAENLNCKIVLPVDVVCAKNIKDNSGIRHCDITNILPDQMVLDVGSKTSKIISEIILKARMVLWNGPLGALEHKPFEKSSVAVANVIKNNAKILNITTLAGGGDTISAIKLARAEKTFSYISKAGGAFLEWLEGKESPGVIALKKNLIN